MPLEVSEAIEAYKKFESRSSAAQSTQMERIKKDRDFLSGDQWDRDDDDLIDPARNRRTVNVLSNSINAVRNQYAAWPYKWYVGDEEIDQVLDSFLNTNSNSRAPQLALYSSTSYGLGAMIMGSESLEGVEVPCLYSPSDITAVRFDPDSVEIDGADAREAAIIEMRSKSYIRSKYGEEYVVGKGYKAPVDITEPHSDDEQAIVTYYRLEDDKCVVYKLLNDSFLVEPVELNLSRIPVFPVYGEMSWHDDKVIWQGLVRKGAPVQTLINYAYTQLGERLAIAPKATWLATVEAVEDLTDGYKNYNRNTNPLLTWNRTTVDGKTVLDPPKRMDNQVQYQDLTSIIGSNLELLSSITGVDSKGIIDSNNVTATEVLYSERSAQTNIRHYFDNLRATFKSVGDCILQMLNVTGVTVQVTQGPEEDMQRQVARQELVQLAGLVPDDKKQAIVDGVLLSHGDNAILRNVYGNMHGAPAPTAMEQQMMGTIEQMKAAIQERDAKMQEMQATLDTYEKSSIDQERGLQSQFAMEDLKHQHELEKMAVKAQLDQGANADQARADAIKTSMDLEKTAVQLDTAKVKADAEKVKALSSIVPEQPAIVEVM